MGYHFDTSSGGGGSGATIEASTGTALVAGDILKAGATSTGSPGSGSAVLGFVAIDTSGYATAYIIPRSNTLASLVSLVAEPQGEIGIATDAAAMVGWNAASGAPNVYLAGGNLQWIGTSANSALANAKYDRQSLPTTAGPFSISLQSQPASTYNNVALGSYDVVINTNGSGSLSSGSSNIFIGKSSQLLGGASTGAAAVSNIGIGDANIQDGFTNNATVIDGSIISLKLSTQTAVVGAGNSYSLSASGITSANLCTNVAIFGNANIVAVSNALTSSNSGKYTCVFGVGNNVTAGFDTIAVAGSYNFWGTVGTDLISGGGCFGNSLQDSGINNAGNLGSAKALLRVGHGSLPNVGYGVEAIIDFICNAVGTGSAGVNGNLILLGSAKQYNSVPQNGTASARGTLSGGRGANVAYQFAFADQGYVATAGATATIPDGCSTYVLNPGAGVTATITFPADPIDGQMLTITNGSANAYTSLTTAANTGQTVRAGLAAVAFAAGAFAKWMYCVSGGGGASTPAATWVRVG